MPTMANDQSSKRLEGWREVGFVRGFPQVVLAQEDESEPSMTQVRAMCSFLAVVISRADVTPAWEMDT